MLLKLKKTPNFQFKIYLIAIISVISFCTVNAQGIKRANMMPDEYIEFEAEDFTEQSNTKKREWKLVTKEITPRVRHDHDPNHSYGASKSKYLELLPDTLYDDNEKKVEGKNYSKTPGQLAILSYNVNFKTSGRYYVWVRGFSANGYDNSIHVGVDGEWPESSQKLFMCQDKWNQWAWSSNQFSNSEKCGGKKRIYIDIKKPGPHKIRFSMREDGFEFDKWVMTKKPTIMPK